jgi:hypothetical protein
MADKFGEKTCGTFTINIDVFEFQESQDCCEAYGTSPRQDIFVDRKLIYHL